jgi:hypothetical protein
MVSERRVYIVGGGLAGMTVAYALAKHGVPVTMLEAGNRLGGKAGADQDDELGLYLDHGFHIFPLWYANVRGLLAELGLSDCLIEAATQHTITRPAGPDRPGQWYTNYPMNSLSHALHNLRASPMAWPEATLASYFLIDIAAEHLSHRMFLDRVSVNGFFRSRFYRSEEVAHFQHFLGLQASSIPGDALSAKTFQKVVQGFIAHRRSLVSILRGDLQTQFIEPFRQRLEQLGVRIHTGLRIHELRLQNARVCDLLVGEYPTVLRTTGRDLIAEYRPLGACIDEPPGPNDIFVLATPPEVTRRFVSDEVYGAEQVGDEEVKQLAGLYNLVSEPMAGMHVVFRRRLDHIPKWHTGLHESRYSFSFIDISQHWPELQRHDRTVLSVIAANVKELQCVKNEKARQKYLLDELLLYLRYGPNGEVNIHDEDIAAVRLTPHFDAPLFLNTTSAWHFRPDGQTRIPNLFVAGDYCRSFADLTTMESAVSSGLTTAGAILEALGKGAGLVKPAEFSLPPCWQLLAPKLLLRPLVWGIAGWRRLRKAPRPESAASEDE